MTKTDVLNRVTLKSTKNEVKPVNSIIAIDPNSPASPRLTYALYNANRAASKINGTKVFNDWHKQGLTHGECLALIAEYNKVTGYVYSPKKKESTKNSPKEAVLKGDIQPAKKGITTKQTKEVTQANDKLAGQIQAIKEMRKEGLLSVAELAEALRLLQV